MAAIETSITNALPGLTQSIESALTGLPTRSTISPRENGITLLDAKNEIFLSYLQTLALRNLAVIRSVGKHVKNKSSITEGAAPSVLNQHIDDQIVKDLVKHRVYLEKGVRPLEDRLKYQIDKVVRAADDEARASASSAASIKKSNKKSTTDKSDEEGSNASDSDEIDEETVRPNLRGFSRAPTASDSTSQGPVMNSAREQAMQEDGIYRPPRITATAMPTTERKEAKEKRPMRSDTIDEYVANELSEAPSAMPSIGSTIVQGGRRDKSAKERKEEEERRDYEESNLVRLPKESKKDKAKKAHQNRGQFGGEDWRGLTQGVDRIDRLTKKKSGTGGALDRSRKRKNEDGQRDDGAGGADMGRDFEKRKKRAMRSR